MTKLVIIICSVKPVHEYNRKRTFDKAFTTSTIRLRFGACAFDNCI